MLSEHIIQADLPACSLIYKPMKLQYSHPPSALENGLQRSTIWTGWQGGLVLEENTLEPNSNRFDPSNSHLLCWSGPGLRTQPLPAILFWASVNMSTGEKTVFHFLIGEHNKKQHKGRIWENKTIPAQTCGQLWIKSQWEALCSVLLMYGSLLMTKLLSEHRANLNNNQCAI